MQRKPLSTINITPLVDVLLILLVVLMLAMPLYVKRLPVSLPETALSGMPTSVKSLPISITKEGQLLMDGTPTQMKDLLVKIDGSVSIDLSIDKVVAYEKIASVISELQVKSPKEINLITN